MADEPKNPKIGYITEEDAAALIQRYPVETVLTLLKEVQRVAGDKIDWDELVKNTATGISCAREYQMLWRHLAYGKNLEDELDSDAKPLDDESDLEYEMEAYPDASPEESALAAACVKVLIASGSNDSHLPGGSTIDAPLTINIRSSKASTASSDSSLLANAVQGTNVTIPVSIQKSTGDLTPREKRRDWSEEEDMKLTAAVQKYGEPDWANIAKGDFEDGRSASELSKRWTILTNSNVGSSSEPSETDVGSSSEPSETDVGSSSEPSETELVASDGAMPMDVTLNVTDQINTARADQPNPVGGTRVMSASSERTNSTASTPSFSLTKNAEGATVSTSGSSGMRDLVQKDQIYYQSDSPFSSPVDQVPHNQLSESEESGYQASVSSGDPGNNTLDAHVPMQFSEDESGDVGVEAASSNSIASTEDEE